MKYFKHKSKEINQVAEEKTIKVKSKKEKEDYLIK